jgi:internalin A
MTRVKKTQAEADPNTSAEDTIKLVIKNHQKVLTLSNMGLYELPAIIGEAHTVEKLILDNNNLSSLPEDLLFLKNLNTIHLRNNQFTEIPLFLAKMNDLRQLKLGRNEIAEISPDIQYMNKLQVLSVWGNKLTNLPDELGAMSNLVTLNVSMNKIEQIPDSIGNLNSVKTLIVRQNKLTELPKSIGRMWKLGVLEANINNISKLPIELTHLKNLRTLDLRNNPISIPPEILEKTTQPKVVLDYYFAQIKDLSKNKLINQAKILVVGQGSVGKTSLIKRFIKNVYDPSQIKTEGIEITYWQVDNKLNDLEKEQTKINLNIWDFGGQEIMHATHQFFLTKRSLYLLVLDSRLTQEENRVEYWLKIIQSFSDESPVLIVGNKIDQHPLDIDRTGLQKKYPNIVGILETSAATGAGIEELKTAIAKQVNNLPHVRDLLPETWFTVKTKLEELGRESNFITHDKYLELCAENEVSDETSQRTLIGFLHDLGVVLHFQDDRRLAELGILNPQWVTNGVYKILNDKALFANKGVLTLPLLDQILSTSEYPQNKRLFIVDMMKKFELCYDIDRDNFLVPDLLPKDEPAELKFNGIPAFEYAYPVLPSSVITRFIVRMNQKIEDGLVWRTGVVLKIGENTALVKADIEDRKITIAIDGQEHTRRDALSAIRYQLDEIHGSIKGLDAQKRVPVPNAPNAEPLEYETLLMLEGEGQEEYLVRDGKRLVKVNVRQVLSGIESEADRKGSGNRVTNIYIGGDVKDSNIIAGDENEV